MIVDKKTYNVRKAISRMKRIERPSAISTKEPLRHDHLIMTIDGSTTAGKRLIGERLAKKYDMTLLNTGTTIRALALLSIENNLIETDETNVRRVPVDFIDRLETLYDTMPNKLTISPPLEGEHTARVMLGERDLHAEIVTSRKQKAIDNISSMIAASPKMRERLYTLWRDAVAQLGGGVIVVGRRTGIDLFPEAQVKLYLFASPEASAAYRVYHDPTATLHQSTEELYVRERDGVDKEHGLLARPDDAMSFDTSQDITKGHVGVEELERRIEQAIGQKYEIIS